MVGVRAAVRLRPSLAFVLLAAFLCVLWVAGGASRADAPGQVVVRAGAWLVVIATLIWGRTDTLLQPRPLWLLLGAAALLALAQLVPLPPGLWRKLPEYQALGGFTLADPRGQVWRPLSISPDLTLNALSSLIVPAALLAAAAGLTEAERDRLPGMLLLMITASMFVGLLQFSGNVFDNPLINDTVGEVSATLANRNHFALFLAIGCLVAPLWAVRGGRARGRLVLAAGLVVMFELTNLATGSRAGLLLGALALAAGLFLIRADLRRVLARYPGWVFPVATACALVLIAGLLLIVIEADRAVSLNRLFSADIGQDMRSRGLPIAIEQVRAVFPYGAGLGSFERAFRAREPFDLLKPTFFNHAHNDPVELLFDAGLPGLLLLLVGLLWWAVKSARAWRDRPREDPRLARLGSGILLLIAFASIVDYPARTPLIMAVATVAALWLEAGPGPRRRSALP